MRILHVAHVYYPSYGGNQMQARGLSETLVALGEEVTVFTTNVREQSQLFRRDHDYRPLAHEEVVNGVAVRRFRPLYRLRRAFCHLAACGIVLSRRLGAKRLGHALDMARVRYPFVPQMLWAIRRHKPDIMLANNGFPATTLICHLASRRFGIPLAIRTTTHVTEGWHKHPFQAEVYRAADLLIANTRFEKEVLVNDLHLDPDKIVTIGNALEAAPFLKADGSTLRARYALGQSKVVAFVGRKVAGKGIDRLIDAMKIVWRQIPSARLIVAGQWDPVYSVPIEEKLAELRPEQAARVIDIDNFSDEEKPQIYAACDVLAMPSNADSFGLVYLEAWASGKPVIACRNTPQETFIDHEENGLLVEYGNVEELAETLCRLLSDDALRTRLGRNGREKVTSTFTWDKVGPKLREHYYRVVNDRRR